MDHLLHDITPLEETRSFVFSGWCNIILDSWNDQQCMYQTKLHNDINDQLIRVYWCFDLPGSPGYLLARNEDHVHVSTGDFNQRGVECCYKFHPEELFLFTWVKCISGKTNKALCNDTFGGNKNRWSYGFSWMLKYLANRYKDILGHQGLLRYVEKFPDFYICIARYDIAKNPRFIITMMEHHMNHMA